MKEADIQRLIFNTCEEDLSTLYDELDLTPKSAADALESIKDWYAKQPHLPPNAIDDCTIARYLVAAKGSVQRTKERIDNMMSARSAMPEFYANRDPYGEDVCGASDSVEIMLAPRLNEQRKRILVMRCTNTDPTMFNSNAANKLLVMVADMRMRYDTNSGDIYVIDFRNVQLGHLLKTTPSVLKKIFFLAQNCYGSRIHRIYMIHLPPYARNFLTIIKSIVKKKIADRIYLVDTLEELHEHIGKEYLPAELKGDQPECRKFVELYFEALRTEEWIRWLRESEKAKSDESKRSQRGDDKVGDMLGIMGSFKRLEID